MSEKNVHPVKNILKIFLPKNLELPGLGEKGRIPVVKTWRTRGKTPSPGRFGELRLLCQVLKAKKGYFSVCLRHDPCRSMMFTAKCILSAHHWPVFLLASPCAFSAFMQRPKHQALIFSTGCHLIYTGSPILSNDMKQLPTISNLLQ